MTVLAVLALGYLNIGRTSLTTVVGTGIVAACVAYVVLYLNDSRRFID